MYNKIIQTSRRSIYIMFFTTEKQYSRSNVFNVEKEQNILYKIIKSLDGHDVMIPKKTRLSDSLYGTLQGIRVGDAGHSVTYVLHISSDNGDTDKKLEIYLRRCRKPEEKEYTIIMDAHYVESDIYSVVTLHKEHNAFSYNVRDIMEQERLNCDHYLDLIINYALYFAGADFTYFASAELIKELKPMEYSANILLCRLDTLQEHQEPHDN